MKSSEQEVIINHSAKDLFKIVLDIEKYSEYIPWCKEIKIKSRTKNKILADMIVYYKYFLLELLNMRIYVLGTEKFTNIHKNGRWIIYINIGTGEVDLARKN